MYENSAAAQKAIFDSRRILSMPGQGHSAWSAMTHTNRVAICAEAGLPDKTATLQWFDMSILKRRALRQAARRMEGAARKLAAVGADQNSNGVAGRIR